MRGAANRHFLLIANNTIFGTIPLSVVALLDRQFVSLRSYSTNSIRKPLRKILILQYILFLQLIAKYIVDRQYKAKSISKLRNMKPVSKQEKQICRKMKQYYSGILMRSLIQIVLTWLKKVLTGILLTIRKMQYLQF